MAENKMKEVAKLLGVELDKPFRIKNMKYNPYTLTKDGLYDCDDEIDNEMFTYLLTGIDKIEQPILDEVEKRYLENVIRPFKDRVNYVWKYEYSDFEYIFINYDAFKTKGHYTRTYTLSLPEFEKDTMYKGMELGKEYTLEELGLFQDEKGSERR